MNFLTDYSTACGDFVVDQWRNLALYLFTKYNDGYVKDATGVPVEAGYPVDYYNKVIEFEGVERYSLPEDFQVKHQPY